jgi:predicted lipid-binding transport protein (Tim44 family)
MGKSKKDTERAAKKSKVVTMPRRDGGEDAEETGKGKKKVAAGKPKSGGAKETKANKKTAEEKLAKDDYKGAKKALRRAVKEAVKKDCGKLADKLMEKAGDGDLHSAEMLLELMEKKKKKGGEGDDMDGPSLAEQLMAGPTWEEVLEARRQAKEEEEAGEAASSC